MNKKIIKTKHGEIITPAFFPDATYGSIKSVSWKDLEKTGTNQVVTTTLHLENKLAQKNKSFETIKGGSQYIKEYGNKFQDSGLHKFFGWEKPILTDSGGYQVFSLIYRSNNLKNTITDAGCSFKDPDSGEYKFLSPEISQIVQYNLGADIVTVLDVPIKQDASTHELRESIKRNTQWAKRSKQKFLELHNLTENDFADNDLTEKLGRPLIGAVIQGGNNKKLRKESVDELLEVGFDLYNFGGAPIHNEKNWRNDAPTGFNREMLEYVSSLIPNDKIKYAMGVGTPDDIIFSAEAGWDIFDTVIPTRNGRHGHLFVSSGEGDQSFENYDLLHVRNERYKFSDDPVDKNCKCECCETVSRSYLRHLIKINESVGWRLASIHNLTFYQRIISTLH